MKIAKRALVIAFVSLLLLTACRGKRAKKANERESVKQATELGKLKRQIRKFKTKSGKLIGVGETRHLLGMSLSNVIITVEGFEDTTPIMLLEIDPIIKIEIADLDGNGFDELYIFTQCVGSGSYGGIIAYDSNRDKKLTPIIVEENLADKAVFGGYMGHDTFSIDGKKIIRKFPVYKEGDSNATPSGGEKTVVYFLQNNKLKVSKWEPYKTINKLSNYVCQRSFTLE